MRNFLIKLLGGITQSEHISRIEESKQEFDYIRNLVKHWDEFREDSNLLIKKYPQIKENEFWLIGHFDIRDKYFSHLYKLQNGKNFEEFEPLELTNDGYINSLRHFLRKRNF